MADGFREWQPGEVQDKEFLLSVPTSAQKHFLRAFRPLDGEASQRVTAALFAGIRQPFHPQRANGWMARLLWSDDAVIVTSFQEGEALLRHRLAWPMTDVVLLVYRKPTVYAAHWQSFLHYFGAGWLDLDTVLVCHPKARDAFLFWENSGPLFGKRGQRELKCPRWGDAEPPREHVPV